MKATLASITTPTVDPAVKTAEDLIVYCARVSNPANQLNVETGDKLLKYCMREGHWSIFEQAHMGIEVKTTRAIAAQILRHSFDVQEFSQRYSTVVEVPDITDARLQSASNRQASDQAASDDVNQRWHRSQRRVYEVAYEEYNKALADGIAREQARDLLPLATPTTLYLNNSVRGWIHYFQARTHMSAQFEHRQLAEECKKIFVSQFPVISKALDWE